MSWQNFLVMAHVVGTALGVGGATFAEIFFLKAMKDGVVDPTESDFMRTTYRVMRVGMAILVLSGFGLLLYYRLVDREAMLYRPKLWAKLTIIVTLLFGVIAWQAKKVPFWLGSAMSITSWYAALVIGTWRGLEASYISIMLGYAVAVVVVAIILRVIRRALKIAV